MARQRVLLIVAALALGTANAGPVQSSGPVADVRMQARTLADDWVRTASVANLDDLAMRTSAFAGLVPRATVDLDGSLMSTNQALMDSAKTILGQYSSEADATAVRNIVYTLDEIAKGNAWGVKNN